MTLGVAILPLPQISWERETTIGPDFLDHVQTPTAQISWVRENTSGPDFLDHV